MHFKSSKICLGLSGLVLLAACNKGLSRLEVQQDPYPAYSDMTDAAPANSPLELGLAFPPLGLDEVPALKQSLLDFSVAQMQDLHLSSLRMSEDWAEREPRPNSYDWPPLEQRLEALTKAQVSVMLTIQSNGPSWRCNTQYEQGCTFSDLNAFSAYVQTLLKRNGERLQRLQFGNEPLSLKNYPGSAAEYLLAWQSFAESVRKINPDLELVLGGFSAQSLDRLAFCHEKQAMRIYTAKRYYTPDNREEFCQQDTVIGQTQDLVRLLQEADYDTVDLHLYDNAEYWPLIYNSIRKLAPGKRILVSEFGGPNPNYEDQSEAYQAQRLKVYLETLRQLPGLEAAYYSQLVPTAEGNSEHPNSTLYYDALPPRPKAAYETFKDISQQQTPSPTRSPN